MPELTEGYVVLGGIQKRYWVYPQEKRTTEDLINYVIGGDMDLQWLFRKLGERDILGHTPKNILEIGSDDEDSAFLLHALGFNVTGIDLMPYKRPLPLTYRRYQGDFLVSAEDFFPEGLQNGVYDTIYSISTLEHFGLQAYHEQELKDDADIQAVKKVYRLLEDDGRFLLTVPVGKYHTNFLNLWRIYDNKTLFERLVPEGFIVDSIEYFLSATIPERPDWQIGRVLSQEEAMSHDDPTLPHCTAGIVMRK